MQQDDDDIGDDGNNNNNNQSGVAERLNFTQSWPAVINLKITQTDRQTWNILRVRIFTVGVPCREHVRTAMPFDLPFSSVQIHLNFPHLALLHNTLHDSPYANDSSFAVRLTSTGVAVRRQRTAVWTKHSVLVQPRTSPQPLTLRTFIQE